jgi:probable phosphoglycerate mutase
MTDVTTRRCVLHLVRHGESTWNLAGRIQGQSPEAGGLTAAGRAQARLTAELLAERPRPAAIIASDLPRARETAEIIAAELGTGGVASVGALRERAAGEWTGLTRQEIERGWPGALEAGRHPPGYEDDDLLVARIVPMLQAIGERFRTVLVLTHGGVIGSVERHLGAEHHRTPNLGGRVVSVEGHELSLGEPLLLVDPHDVMVTSPPES